MDAIQPKNEYKLLTALFLIYISSILIFSTQQSLLVYSQVAFLASIGGYAAVMTVKNIPLQLDPFLKLFALFICFCFLSSIWAKSADDVFSRCWTLVQLFLMCVILVSFLVHARQTETAVLCIMAAGLLCSVYILAYYGLEGYVELLEEGERAGADITNVNSIGMYMSISAIICFYYAFVQKKKWFYLLLLLPVFLSLGSGSRKALVLLVAGVFLLIIVRYRNHINGGNILKLIAALLILAALLWIISTIPLFQTVFERLFSMFAEGNMQDSSAVKREQMVEIGWLYFLNHPFSGAGIANSAYITQEYMGLRTYLHNNFVELLATVGIFGFILYYSIYFYLVKNLFCLYKKTGKTLTVLILILLILKLVMDYGMVSYYDKMNYIYLSIAAAEVCMEKRKQKEMEHSERRENFGVN